MSACRVGDVVETDAADGADMEDDSETARGTVVDEMGAGSRTDGMGVLDGTSAGVTDKTDAIADTTGAVTEDHWTLH